VSEWKPIDAPEGQWSSIEAGPDSAGARSATAAIVGIGKGSLTILAVMILTTCCVGFWALAGGLMLASGAILACGMMALQIIRRWRNG
jgi:hypothetical protein